MLYVVNSGDQALSGQYVGIVPIGKTVISEAKKVAIEDYLAKYITEKTLKIVDEEDAPIVEESIIPAPEKIDPDKPTTKKVEKKKTTKKKK